MIEQAYQLPRYRRAGDAEVFAAVLLMALSLRMDDRSACKVLAKHYLGYI